MDDSRPVAELVAALRYARAVNAALPCDENADTLAERFFRDAHREPARKKLPRRRTAP